MDFSQMNENSIDLQKILQRMMKEETIKNKVDLYSCFKMHFFENRSQIMQVLNKRKQLFASVFWGLSKIQEHKQIISLPTDSQKAEEMTTPAEVKLVAVEMNIASMIDESMLNPTANNNSTAVYDLQYLHQFLGESNYITGYKGIVFDVFVNRFTLNWTIVAFYQHKDEESDPISVILQAFRELNPDDECISLNEFMNTFTNFENQTDLKCIKKQIEKSGWNMNSFKKIEITNNWDFSLGQIQKKKLDSIKSNNMEAQSSLFADAFNKSVKQPKKQEKQFDLYSLDNLVENTAIIRKIEAIMKLHIETMSNIDLTDPDWNLMLAFDQHSRLCGFMSYFKFGVDYQNHKIRISQVFVLPDSRRMNLATKMLQGIYSLYADIPEATENIIKTSFMDYIRDFPKDFNHISVQKGNKGITIEAPSPEFTIVLIKFLLNKKNHYL